MKFNLVFKLVQWLYRIIDRRISMGMPFTRKKNDFIGTVLADRSATSARCS